MTRTKILMLSVSAGTGHIRAAEALRSYADSANAEVSASHLDILRLVSPFLRLLYADFYMFLVRRAPALWGLLYRATNQASRDGVAHRLRRWGERLNSHELRVEIARARPDVIICTHFLPADILSQLIAAGVVDCPVWVQVTDFDLHKMWVHERMTGYFAPNHEVAFQLLEQGIPAAAIHVTGIPIMPVFSAPLSRAVCARELRLDPGTITLLVMGGSPALGSVVQVAAHLLGMAVKLQIIALAGKSAPTLAALKDLAERHPGRLAPQGYTDKIERLMACADIVVTKPGGLTTSESLAMGLPMVVISPIPGQEEFNANFLLEQGVALQAFDLVTLEYRIRHLLDHPAHLDQMRVKARSLGRPNAAGKVLGIALGKTE